MPCIWPRSIARTDVVKLGDGRAIWLRVWHLNLKSIAVWPMHVRVELDWQSLTAGQRHEVRRALFEGRAVADPRLAPEVVAQGRRYLATRRHSRWRLAARAFGFVLAVVFVIIAARHGLVDLIVILQPLVAWLVVHVRWRRRSVRVRRAIRLNAELAQRYGLTLRLRPTTVNRREPALWWPALATFILLATAGAAYATRPHPGLARARFVQAVGEICARERQGFHSALVGPAPALWTEEVTATATVEGQTLQALRNLRPPPSARRGLAAVIVLRQHELNLLKHRLLKGPIQTRDEFFALSFQAEKLRMRYGQAEARLGAPSCE